MAHEVRPSDQFAAAAALLWALVAAAFAVEFVLEHFPRGLMITACALASLALAWYGLTGAGPAPMIGYAGSFAALVAGIVLLSNGSELWRFVLVLAATGLSAAAARRAFRVRVPLPDAPDPHRAVLFYNPASGGGKAARFGLAEEAEKRGIKAVRMELGGDLDELVRTEVASGADALAMAGGDGSQAVVAAVASEFDLPYACIPAGTRNHFALDLGVDREDVVGALDAFVSGGERRVDLAEVNGRVFVNNVSLGVYAEAVQRDGYREAKLKNLIEAGAEMASADERDRLSWHSPSGREHVSAAAILVSNNRYRIGRALGSGTRPRIDDGMLGVTVFTDPLARKRPVQRPWRQWSATEFEVDARKPVAAGIDGEAAELPPPLKFHIRPAALRVRIARQHPGASPSAAMPHGLLLGTKALMRIVMGHPPAVRAHSLDASIPSEARDV
jgi:diacylglycerol kinase family enzyme